MYTIQYSGYKNYLKLQLSMGKVFANRLSVVNDSFFKVDFFECAKGNLKYAFFNIFY